MKNKYSLLVLLFVLPLVGRAQMTLHWTDSIPNHVNSVIYSSETYLDSNSNFYSGISRNFSADLILQKRDSSGALLWETQLYPDSAVPDTDNVSSYIIRIDKNQNTITSLQGCPLVRKLSPSGSTIFKTFLPGRSIVSIQPVSDNNTYIISILFGKTILNILDSAGVVIKADTLADGGAYSWDCIREDAFGNVIVYYRNNSGQTSFYHYRNDQFLDSISVPVQVGFQIDQFGNRYIYDYWGSLTKYDSVWTQQWTINSGAIGQLKIDSSGNIITTRYQGQTQQDTLKKYNSSGVLLWSYAFNSPQTIYTINALDINQRNELVISGVKYNLPIINGQTNGIFVATISSDGRLLRYYKKYIPGVSYGSIYQQALNKNDQYFFMDFGDQTKILNCLNLNSHPNIVGLLYYDADTDCLYDTLEAALPEINVTLNPGNFYDRSFVDGKYMFEVPDGNYLLDHSTPANWQSTCPVGQVAVTVTNGIMSGPSLFGLTAIPNQSDLSIDFTHSRVRPNTDITFVLHYQNLGTTVISGEVQFYFDTMFTYVSSQTIPDVISNDSLIWNFNGLIPGESRYIIFVLHAAIVPAGTIYTNTASIVSYIGEAHPENNSQTESTEVLTSFDPNEKYVSPKGSGPGGNISYADSLLFYKIVFQNTGNDTAFYVQVIDTLDPSLDPLTFFTGAIYPSGTCTLSRDGVLRFVFDPVLIPDSTTDEPNSHGFINYFIKTRPNLPLGTTIRNKADIYFDYNAPVTTNSTINTINSTVSVSTIDRSTDSYLVYPNPANEKIFIVSEKSDDYFEATLFTTEGKQACDIMKGRGSIQIDVKKQMPGVYILKLLKGDTITFKNVVVIRN